MDRLAKLTRERVPFAQEYYDWLNYESDVDGGYRLVPNQRLPHITINESGFRGKPFTGTEKILLLGDSVTFGIGAEDDSSVFSRFLEKHSGVAVADASVRAYRVEQHLRRLPELLDRLPEVQAVILWGGYADLLYWVTSGGKTEGVFKFSQTYACRSALENTLRSWFSPKRFMWMFTRPSRDFSKVEPVKSLADRVADGVIAIDLLCKERRKGFLFLLQPFVRRQDGSDATIGEIAVECDKKTASKCGVSWRDAADGFVARLRERLSGVLQKNLVDCQGFVSDNDFLDQVHLTSSAADRLSKKILPSVENLMKGAL